MNVYQYRVWGGTLDEVERKARAEAVSFFGSDAVYDLDIDARAMQTVSGQVLTVEADCTAVHKSRTAPPVIRFDPDLNPK